MLVLDPLLQEPVQRLRDHEVGGRLEFVGESLELGVLGDAVFGLAQEFLQAHELDRGLEIHIAGDAEMRGHQPAVGGAAQLAAGDGVIRARQVHDHGVVDAADDRRRMGGDDELQAGSTRSCIAG